MRLRIIHTFFYPSKDSVSQILSDLAFHLADEGHDVEAIATSGDYLGGGRRLPRRQTVHGVEIRRVWGPSLGKKSVLTRLADLSSYCLGAFFRCLLSRRADKLLVMTNPPIFAPLAALLHGLRREPYVYVVMDLYPDVAVQAGVLSPGSLSQRVGRWMTRRALLNADRVVVLGSCMAQVIADYGVPGERIVIIQNWSDGQAIRPRPPADNPLRKEWNLGGKFVVMYSGNMGVGHRFEDILAAADRLRDRDDIHFLFVGGGVRRAEVERFRDEKDLANLTVRDYAPRELLGQSLCVGDCHFISLREGFEGLIVPSKAYGVMAAGRPMIYQGSRRGEIARMLDQEGGGAVVSEGDVDRLAELIRTWADNPAEARRIGHQARTVFETHYTQPIGLAKYQRVLEE